MVAEPYRTEKLGKMVVSPFDPKQFQSSHPWLGRAECGPTTLCSLVLHGLLLPLE